MIEKPSDEEMREAFVITADLNSPVGVLRRYRLWADEQIAQLLERNTNQAKSIAELREESDNLRDDNAKHRNDYRLRGEQLAELTAERDSFRDQANAAINRQIELREKFTELTRVNERQQRVISRMEVSIAADKSRLSVELAKSRTGNRNLTAERDRLLREVTELRERVDEFMGTVTVSKPSVPVYEVTESVKEKVYADAELGVIADCLEAMKRIEPSQRSTVAQYLLSRAQTTAWLNLPQAPAQQAPGLGGQW